MQHNLLHLEQFPEARLPWEKKSEQAVNFAKLRARNL